MVYVLDADSGHPVSLMLNTRLRVMFKAFFRRNFLCHEKIPGLILEVSVLLGTSVCDSQVEERSGLY